MQVVHITWIDAESPPETWMEDEEVPKYLKKDTTVESCGFLVAEDKKYILLALDRDLDGAWGSMTKIPKSLIVKRKVMR